MWPLTRNGTAKPRKKAAPKRGEKQAQSLKMRRRLSSLFRLSTLILVSGAVVSAVYVWQSGRLQEWVAEAGNTTDRLVADAGFKVAEVRVFGQENTALADIRRALAFYDGQSIVSLDLAQMLQRVKALPWVETATLMRIMPDALEVTIVEYRPTAIWQRDGQLFLVDERGRVITDRGAENFSGLPHVVGDGAGDNIREITAMRDKHPALFDRVKSAVRVGGRRWDLNFRNGVKIKLPERGWALAWDQLYEYESGQGLLSKEVLVVDLRLHGKTVIRLTPEEAERRRLIREAGKDSGKKENI